MRKCLILLSFFFYAVATPAQTSIIDSLKSFLHTQKADTNKVTTLNKISRNLYNKGGFDSALHFANEALSLARKINYKKGEAAAYMNRGYINEELLNFNQSRSDYYTAVKIRQEIQCKCATGGYLAIAHTYHLEDNYPEELKILFKALRLYEKDNDKEGIGNTYLSIGGAYYDFGNFIESRRYYSLSFKTFEKLRSKENMANALTLLSMVEIDLGRDTVLALQNTLSALKTYEAINNQWGIALVQMYAGRILLKQGEAYFVKRNYSEAKEKFAQAEAKCLAALKYFENNSSTSGLVNSYISLGNIYLGLRDMTKSRYYLEKCKQLSLKIKNKYETRDSYQGLAKLDSLQGNYEGAYKNFRLYILYKDSIANEENTNKVLQHSMQYEFDKKEALAKAAQEKKDALAVAEIKNQKLFRNFSLVGAMVVVSFVSFSFYRYHRRRKLHSEQEMLNERLRISSELHDEIGATLSGIAMYSHLTQSQMQSGQTAAVTKSLNIIQQSCGDIVTKLNDIVWLLNPNQDSLEKLINRLEEYAVNMGAVKGLTVKAMIPDSIAEVTLPIEARRNIYLLCKEAINNAVKYSEATLLELMIKVMEGKLEVIIQDNGKGFDPKMLKRGNGLGNMKKRAEEIGGIFNFHSELNKGTTVRLLC